VTNAVVATVALAAIVLAVVLSKRGDRDDE
jgi:hypothetical protein